MYASIPPEEVGFSAAQFELANFYRSELVPTQAALTDTSVITSGESEEYLRALMGCLLHAENYNKTIAPEDKINVDAEYDTLLKILLTGDIRQKLHVVKTAESTLSAFEADMKDQLIKYMQGCGQRPVDCDLLKEINEFLFSGPQATSSSASSLLSSSPSMRL